MVWTFDFLARDVGAVLSSFEVFGYNRVTSCSIFWHLLTFLHFLAHLVTIWAQFGHFLTFFALFSSFGTIWAQFGHFLTFLGTMWALFLVLAVFIPISPTVEFTRSTCVLY